MKTFHRNSILSMLLFFSILFTILAFLPFLGRPGFETRDALTPNRIIEISFLLLSASLLTGSVIAFRVGLRFDRTPVYLVGSFSIWALLSTIWSESPLYTFGKSLEFIVLLYNTTLISSISLHFPIVPNIFSTLFLSSKITSESAQ